MSGRSANAKWQVGEGPQEFGGPRGNRGKRGGPWGGGGGGGSWSSGGPWGFSGMRGEPGGRGGRRRMRRGDIRKSVLLALLDGPANGYEVMTRLEVRSGGAWRPSPGSVYPTLQMLEDEGMARVEARDGQKIYGLTDEGSAEASSAARSSEAPWASLDAGGEGMHSLRLAAVQLLVAAKQVSHAASPAQLGRATEIVNRARKELYSLLAEE